MMMIMMMTKIYASLDPGTSKLKDKQERYQVQGRQRSG